MDIEKPTDEEWEELSTTMMWAVGYIGRKDMAIKAMQESLNKEREKRKRDERDVGRMSEGIKGPRTYAIPKRQLLRNAMRGLMGSRYANIMTKEEQTRRQKETEEAEWRN